MANVTRFTIGVDAGCVDGTCGELSRLVVDPVSRSVTHLVVEPPHRRGLGRLVPLELVDTAGNEIQIRCTRAEFDELEAAERTLFLEGLIGESSPEAELYVGMGNVSPPVTYDTVPVGEVSVRRGQHVHATDGNIGWVQGLVIDPDNHHVTQVLLQQGRLWNRKEVAIPIDAVAAFDDGIQLNLTKQDLDDLPAVDRRNLNRNP
ncbi:MAG: PRC-barrel domain-containing protein [Acidimicrobiia bacterium]